MSLHHQTLHEGRLLHVGCVCCRPESGACSNLEHTWSNTVELPLRGVFIKHHEHGVDADYAPSYYAAFLTDPDGNNIEAVCMVT